MKKFLPLIVLLISSYSKAQFICGTANEGGVVTLTAPAGNVFTSIEFSSYGTPNGSCGSFTIGACHAANSIAICEAEFLGKNSSSINATNGVFGDPCGGTPKRLYIQAAYSSVLPLTLISFTAKKTEPDKVRLDWLTDDEINTSHFVIERSTDGVLFEVAGSVPVTGGNGSSYNFTNTILHGIPTYYYRLNMVDKDGRNKYSNIVRINNNNITGIKLSVFPSPATEFITIISSKHQELEITNTIGRVIRKIVLINGNNTVNISGWNTGVYFIKTEEGVLKFIKQ